MKTIEVRRLLRAPIERVFEVLSDHAGYTSLPGVTSAKVTQPGTSEPNGVGAVREIALGGAWFREEITAFERPNRLDYRIIKSRPPVEHELGSIRLKSLPEGTEVTWTSTFRIKLPVLGWLATRLAARKMARTFSDGLKAVEDRARS